MSPTPQVTLPASALSLLMKAGDEAPAPAPAVPPVPQRLEDTGLPTTFFEQHILRVLYFRGEMVGRELSRAVGLKYSIIEPIIDHFRRQQLIDMRRSAGMGSVSGQFGLTEQGRKIAREHLEMSLYTGPAPVPLAQYAEMVRKQHPPAGWLSPEALHRVYSRMVLGADILGKIGPAVSSGNSFLIYGQPGNGKTFLAEALIELDRAPIYLPYSIEYQGSIIQIFDPIFHSVIEDEQSLSAITLEPAHDPRWFRCRRPFIVSGGELALDMLDLKYNETSKVYDAPLQLKANNGIYLIDDFGRQIAAPAEILNRWIVPMERRVDYLTLRNGGKVTVPFDAFLVFSTNLKPDQLGDEAFLRRIQYKMHLRNPTADEFMLIFRNFCQAKGLLAPEGIEQWFVDKYYRSTGKRMRRCHPRDVISHALDLINFEKRPFELTHELLEHAFESCFVQVADMEA